MDVRELNPDWPPHPQPSRQERLAAVAQAEQRMPAELVSEMNDDGDEWWPNPETKTLGRVREYPAGGFWADLEWCVSCLMLRSGPHPHPLPEAEGCEGWLVGVSDNSRDLASPRRLVETQVDGWGQEWAVDDGLGIVFPEEIHDLTLNVPAQEWWRQAKALARLRTSEKWRTELPAWEREPSPEWEQARRERTGD